MSLTKRNPSSSDGIGRQHFNVGPPSCVSPEHLVGIGFRCWLAGHQSGDISHWEQGWNYCAGQLGPDCARPIVDQLSAWTETVDRAKARQIETYPFGSAGFCRDECMAISLVAAVQHDACVAMKACAFALIECGDLDSLIYATTNMAHVLGEQQLQLRETSIVNATAFLAEPSPGPDRWN